MPVVACSVRNHSQIGVRSIMAKRIPQTCRSRARSTAHSAASLGFGVHLLQEGGRRNTPLLLEVDELAALVPVLDRLGDELAPRAVAFLQLDRGTPRGHQ